MEKNIVHSFFKFIALRGGKMQHIIFYEMDIRICNKSLLISIKMNFYNEILLSPYRSTCIFYM